MIKRIFNALALAAQLLLGDWRALIILFVLYLAMLGAVYLFFVTREATVGQLILSLPLAAIHLWIETASSGLRKTIKSSPRILARALAPHPVLTYLIGFVFFAVVPYFLIVTRTQMTNAWLDFGLLTARLILAAALSLVGWVVTVGALGQLKASSGSERIAQPGEANAPAEA